MAARQQASDAEADLRILAEDHPVQLGEHCFDLRMQRVHWFLSVVTRASLGRQLAYFRAQFLKPLLVLGDDLRRRILGKLAVAQFGLQFAASRHRLCAAAWPGARVRRRGRSALPWAPIFQACRARQRRKSARLARFQHARRLDAGKPHQVVQIAAEISRSRGPAFCSRHLELAGRAGYPFRRGSAARLG